MPSGGFSLDSTVGRTDSARSKPTASSWIKRVLTAEEAAADGGDDDLKSEERTHSDENRPAFLVDCVNADDVHDGAHCQQDGCAYGFKQVETATLLCGSLSVGQPR